MEEVVERVYEVVAVGGNLVSAGTVRAAARSTGLIYEYEDPLDPSSAGREVRSLTVSLTVPDRLAGVAREILEASLLGTARVSLSRFLRKSLGFHEFAPAIRVRGIARPEDREGLLVVRACDSLRMALRSELGGRMFVSRPCFEVIPGGWVAFDAEVAGILESERRIETGMVRLAVDSQLGWVTRSVGVSDHPAELPEMVG